jgi:hypothetical protein
MRRPFGTAQVWEVWRLERVFDYLTLYARWLASSNQREEAPVLVPIFTWVLEAGVTYLDLALPLSEWHLKSWCGAAPSSLVPTR